MTNAALIIDLDGTFYDSREIDQENKSAAIHAIAEHRKIPIEEAYLLLKKAHSLGQTSTASILDSMKIPDKLIEKYQLVMMHPETHIQADLELATLLRNLKSRYRIVLLTNTRRQIAIRALQTITLLESDFDLILAGGDIAKPKPSVDTLQQALNAVNCEPSISYTIGDRWEVDHAPGQELGMHAIEVQGRNEFVAWLKSMQISSN